MVSQVGEVGAGRKKLKRPGPAKADRKKFKAAQGQPPRAAFAGCDVRICFVAAPGSELHFRTALPKVRWILRAFCEPKFAVVAFDWWSDPAGLGLTP